MRCSNCGTENTNESKFCLNCGQPLKEGKISVLDKLDMHNLEMKIKRDNEEFNDEKEKKDLQYGIKIFIVIFVIGAIAIFLGLKFGSKDPTLSSYNSLQLGMTYEECRDKLGSEGHITLEEDNKKTYVWYSVYCDSDCEAIIELNFENNKLIKRKENGLK